jgi:hypothetical protein
VIRAEVLDWFEDKLFRENVHRQLIERQAAKKFHIRARQSRKYIAAARARWMANRTENLEDIREELDGALRELHQKAMRAGKFSAAARALVSRAQLHGAIGATETNVTVTATAALMPLHGDPEKDRARLEELRRLDAERKKDGGQ